MSAAEHGKFSVKDAVTVVTGASSGIGRHLATAFAEHGARVVAVDSNSARLLSWCGDLAAIRGIACDVRDETAVTATMADVRVREGVPSVVINCAAVADYDSCDEISLDRFRETLDVNVTGSFVVARAAARLMRAVGYGSIILVGSQLGRVTRPERSAYSTSKAAVEMLTKVLSHDYATAGVRVNCLAPGPVLTERTRERLTGADRESSGGRMLIGRYLDPEDLVGPAMYLASPASQGMTGATLLVDGGYTVM